MDPPHVSCPPATAPVETLRLTVCPRCEYSLTGLPAVHRCPECGFEYDDRTFVLTGIARGAGSMRPERKVLWAVLACAVWLGPWLAAPFFAAAGDIACLVFATGCLAVLVYLLATGKHERGGDEKFIFARGGFGYCAALKPTAIVDARLTPWSDVDAFLIERKGAAWYRIRISRRRSPRGVCLDVGVRCTEPVAAWIRTVLEQRIRESRPCDTTPGQTSPGD